jgi:hypothetical protein
METNAFSRVVWCDLGIVLLKIHSRSPWNTRMVSTCRTPELSKPTVNVYICDDDDAVFENPVTYRERMMRLGSYRGHTFGPPARLKWIDDRNVALAHPDPGKIIWAYVIKYVLTVHAIQASVLHLKGAAVAYRGKAFLFLGRGGSGKTEVVQALCRNGARLVANTHLLVDGGVVCGITSNVRVRDDGCDVYVPVDRQQTLDADDGWLPIGRVFWVKYRTDGESLVRTLPSSYARANLQYFAEAVTNWELKEDLADYFGSDPFEFAEQVNRTDRMLIEFCENHEFYYLNLDVFSDAGMRKLMSVMESVPK